MSLISSAQNQEDIMLWRALHTVENGFYIDVGAADPVAYSVTRLFYDHGWSGINLEPNPAFFEMLERDRPRDINLPVGAGAQSGAMTFHVIADSGLSTFDSCIAASHEAGGYAVTENVAQVLTLAEICRLYRPQGPIHFLKIDVEGFEQAVLAGADFKTFRPWIILAEATLPMSPEPSYAQWEPLLTGQGYSFAWFDGLNRFYLADEKQAALAPFFQVQPNIFDPFVPAADLVQRAETAERALAAALADAALKDGEYEARAARAGVVLRQTIENLARQAMLTAQAQDRCGALENLLAQERAVHAHYPARLNAAQAERDSALARAGIAESWRAAMAASTSWRITAPLRKAVGLFQKPAAAPAESKFETGASASMEN